MLQDIMGIKIQLTPRTMLLLENVKGIKEELTSHMWTVAVLLIAQGWKSTEVPTVSEWIVKVRYMCLMNKCSVMCRYRGGQTNAIKNL